MPGFLLDQSAAVMCAHAGKAQPAAPFPRVKLLGNPVVAQTSPYTVAGCPNVPPAGVPCAAALFSTGALRVKVMGQPVLLADSLATAVPTGLPLVITVTQVRVKGQ